MALLHTSPPQVISSFFLLIHFLVFVRRTVEAGGDHVPNMEKSNSQYMLRTSGPCEVNVVP